CSWHKIAQQADVLSLARPRPLPTPLCGSHARPNRQGRTVRIVRPGRRRHHDLWRIGKALARGAVALRRWTEQTAIAAHLARDSHGKPPGRSTHPRQSRVVAVLARQLIKRARACVNLIFVFPRRKALVLVKVIAIPLRGNEAHIPRLPLRRKRISARRFRRRHLVNRNRKTRKHANRRLGTLLAPTARLLLDKYPRRLVKRAVDLGRLL